MIRHIKNIIAGFMREAGYIAKDINLIMVLLAAPVFYAFFYSTVYVNKVEKEVPIAVINMDNSTYSAKLIRKLDAHQMIDIYEELTDYQSGVDEINNETVHGLVLIPRNFSNDLKSGKGTDIKIYLNTSRFLVSNDLNKAINEVLAYSGMEVRMKYFMSQGFSYEQSKELIEPLRLDMRSLFNFTESYGDFMIPALIVLILQQTLLIGMSESIAKEREFSTLHELYSTTGRSVFGAIAGKGSFYFVLYSIYAFFFFAVNFSVFNIQIAGSIFALVTMLAILISSVICLTFFVASFFHRKIIALQFLTITSYPVFLISGYSWPVSAMPWLIRMITALLPGTPFLNAYQRIVMMGADLNDVKFELLHILVLLLVYFAAAYLRMKKLFNTHKYKTQKIFVTQ